MSTQTSRTDAGAPDGALAGPEGRPKILQAAAARRVSAAPGVGGRREADHYPTPEWVVDAVLPHLLHRCPPRPGAGYVLEPGCGAGGLARVLARAGYHVRGVDIRAEAACPVELFDSGGTYLAVEDDYLQPVKRGADFDAWPLPMAIVGNPPYSFAMEFLRVSIDLLARRERRESGPPGLLAFLLPLDYLGSQGRAAFWRGNPADVLVLDKRPSFTGGGTAATNYGWLMWPPANGVRGQVYRVGEAP
jgi:SAM-dependent methyltransferase